MAYDENNVFARIIRGELPSVKVWETEDILCIMDAFPKTPGHCLVMPKSPVETALHMEPQAWADLMSAVYTTAHAVSGAFPECGVVILQCNGRQAGQVVPHVHVHIIPRRFAGHDDQHERIAAPPRLLEDNAHKIKASLGII